MQHLGTVTSSGGLRPQPRLHLGTWQSFSLVPSASSLSTCSSVARQVVMPLSIRHGLMSSRGTKKKLSQDVLSPAAVVTDHSALFRDCREEPILQAFKAIAQNKSDISGELRYRGPELWGSPAN